MCLICVEICVLLKPTFTLGVIIEFELGLIFTMVIGCEKTNLEECSGCFPSIIITHPYLFVYPLVTVSLLYLHLLLRAMDAYILL